MRMNTSIKTLEDFYTQTAPWIANFDHFAEKHQLMSRARADHICYKCDSSEVFEFIRSLFEERAGYIYQSIISKRRIAIIKLPKSIDTILGPIHFLELSDQKPDSSQTNRFDHIEVYPVCWTYDAMVDELSKTESVIQADRPHHPTHDILISDTFLFRCTREPLIEKIKREELK